MSLAELAELLGSACEGRVIHFGSCETLDVHGQKLNAFLRQTGAVALMGYRETTDWVESAAFEALLLGELQQLSMTKRGMTALERRVRERVPGLSKLLGFRMVVRRS